MNVAKLLFFSLFLIFNFNGCEKKKISTELHEVHWDRDMCERCKMAVSERKYAVQIIDPKTGKNYKFDDIGCAVLWMDEEKIPWKDRAIIWITDLKTGEWIDARKAKYVEGSITPMAYGFAAYNEQTLPKNSYVMDYAAVAEKIREIEKINSQRVRTY